MATVEAAPHTPAPSRKSVFSSSASSRRTSTSNASGMQISQGIGYFPGPTPTPTTPAGSGIPAFRTLRSLLPFGPSKNQNASTPSLLSPPSSKSPFASFGSVRKSMTRERKTSLSNDAISPVIAIEGPLADESAIRRSASLSRIEKPLPREPDYGGMFADEHGTLASAFTLRTPSPGPPLTAELSTIMEADSSGVSKNPPDSQPAPSKPPTHLAHSESIDFDLDLSTTEVANQVRDALKKSTSSSQSGKEWLNPDKAVVIIDADEHPDVADKSFNNVDPDLVALLSPNSGSKNGSSHSLQRTPTTPTFPSSPSLVPRVRQASSFLPRLRPSPSASPTSPRFSIPTPSPTTPSTTSTPRPSPEKRPSIAINGYGRSPPSVPASPSSPSASTSTPVAPGRSLTAPRSPSLFNPPSGRVFSGLLRNNEDKTTPSQITEKTRPTTTTTRTLRQVMLGVSRGKDASASGSGDSSSFPSPSPITPLSRGSLDSRRPPPPASLGSELGLGRPSLDVRRSSFDSRPRPSHHKHASRHGSSSPERVMTDRGHEQPDFSPSLDREAGPFDDTPYRPSIDSTATRPSFDTSSRPGSVARLRERDRERERAATPSLRVTDTSGGDRASPVPRGLAGSSGRTRKRSMSVQERIAKGRYVNGGVMSGSENGGNGASISRPASSLSVHNTGRRAFGDENSGRESPVGLSGSGTGPAKMEWLGPRTAKAFKAAGLLDFDRDREHVGKERAQDNGDGLNRLRDRSSSVSAGPSPSPFGASMTSVSRFGSIRSASEYNPGHTRAQSRMTYSEVGGPTGGASARRGSGTFSAYGGGGSGGGGGSSYGGGSQYGYQGLMESPTFTVSSSSRDTPKSTSTAPTSLSESFGYMGRDRTERDREEIRELKEKHATEMGALLGALSDTQRTVRLLREENTELRERLERASGVLKENNDLRHALDSVEREFSAMRRELASLRAIKAPALAPSWSGSSGASSGLRTPIPKPGNSSPLAMDSTPSFIRHQETAQEEGLFNDTIIIHNTVDDEQNGGYESSDDGEPTPAGDLLPPSSARSSLRRRRSDTSSIFPIPPANMTMLLHDDTTTNFVNSNRSSADQSQYPFSILPHPKSVHHESTASKPKPKPIATPQAVHHHTHPHFHTHSSHPLSQSQTPPPPPPQTQTQTQPITYRNFAGPGHVNNKSVTSTTSISPTIANFSMVTGSPGSLYLRPEHEILLGDMESLDLGMSGPDSEPGNRAASEDGW